ncbi:MAG: hypothetical protein HQM08_16900 [Candidatus Riflebacteria bacterium]|nr:hypothetical protein [Candidatus Riflebacteria bacterium]
MKRCFIYLCVCAILSGSVFFAGCGGSDGTSNPVGPTIQGTLGDIQPLDIFKIAEVSGTGQNVVPLGKSISGLNTFSFQVRIANVDKNFAPTLTIKVAKGNDLLLTRSSAVTNVALYSCSNLQVKEVDTFDSLTFSAPIPTNASVRVYDCDRPADGVSASARASLPTTTLGGMADRCCFDVDTVQGVNTNDIVMMQAWLLQQTADDKRNYSKIKTTATTLYSKVTLPDTEDFINLPRIELDDLDGVASNATSVVTIDDIALAVAWMQSGRPVLPTSPTWANPVMVMVASRAQEIYPNLATLDPAKVLFPMTPVGTLCVFPSGANKLSPADAPINQSNFQVRITSLNNIYGMTTSPYLLYQENGNVLKTSAALSTTWKSVIGYDSPDISKNVDPFTSFIITPPIRKPASFKINNGSLRSVLRGTRQTIGLDFNCTVSVWDMGIDPVFATLKSKVGGDDPMAISTYFGSDGSGSAPITQIDTSAVKFANPKAICNFNFVNNTNSGYAIVDSGNNALRFCYKAGALINKTVTLKLVDDTNNYGMPVGIAPGSFYYSGVNDVSTRTLFITTKVFNSNVVTKYRILAIPISDGNDVLVPAGFGTPVVISEIDASQNYSFDGPIYLNRSGTINNGDTTKNFFVVDTLNNKILSVAIGSYDNGTYASPAVTVVAKPSDFEGNFVPKDMAVLIDSRSTVASATMFITDSGNGGIQRCYSATGANWTVASRYPMPDTKFTSPRGIFLPYSVYGMDTFALVGTQAAGDTLGKVTLMIYNAKTGMLTDPQVFVSSAALQNPVYITNGGNGVFIVNDSSDPTKGHNIQGLTFVNSNPM